MPKLSNIIQRRELEPLLTKAQKIVKHYEKAANCTASVMGPDCDDGSNYFNSLCKHCSGNTSKTACSAMHKEAVSEARRLKGSYIYVCPAGFVFWTSPFYSGERFAGALLSGGVRRSEENSSKVRSLAQMMLICADQISAMSFVQKNITTRLTIPPQPAVQAAPEPGCGCANEKKAPNAGYSMDMERMLLASLRRGDNVDALKMLEKLLDTLYKEVKGRFPIFRLKAMELAVLLSRAAADPKDIKDGSVLDENTRYLKKIEECATPGEITEILSFITERMSGKIFSFHGVRHFSALRKAERYIWENYTRKLSLQEIADASGLSAPYFSTIFKEEMGENLSNYLNRLRVEKAAAMLVTTNLSISGIASACGFEDQSWFSKIFKNNTGFTPGKYREQGNILG
jgi:AraC-like DNA-binding protein/ligand-binding sensor protein